MDPIGIALVIAILILSLGIHEAAHGWVALQCGDPTARNLGRITLNPIPHIDPFMTIVMPLILIIATGGQFVFGGARPVPVNFYGLRRPYRDMALVAMAGPVSNLLIAGFLVLVLKLIGEFGSWGLEDRGTMVLQSGIFLNLLLAAFNLVPVPPLDGSRVMTWLLPASLRESYAGLERFGMLLVFVLIFAVPGFQHFLLSTIGVLYGMVHWVVTAGGLW